MECHDVVSMRIAVPPDRHDFRVAIMCALPLEATAVAALFEDQWDTSELNKEPSDPNAYSVGSIGRHSVVLVHMPRMGKVPSASVAAHLKRSFPNLGLVLMVGICGGVPFSAGEQRMLGDVVISEGIVQYDMGKQLVDRYVKILPTQQPGFGVSAVLKKLQTLKERKRLKDNSLDNLERLQHRAELEGSAEYPGREWDRVFRPDYLHRHRGTSICENCSDDKVCDESVKMACDELGCSDQGLDTMLFSTQDSPRPAVHFGLIASGDTVVRSGKFRDEIAKQTNAIAFEMEGAGMCTEFPNFLVIKGICDYADSHKNKKFQGYAAATAAAVTGGLLQYWTPPFASVNRVALGSPRSKEAKAALSVEDYKLLNYFETTPYRDRKDRNPNRIQGTCQWFLEHPIFCSWDRGDSRALWVSADPGCGKSVLAKFLVENVLVSTATRTTCYFFFKDDFQDQKSATNAISCILHQVFKQKPGLFFEDVRAQLQADDREKLVGSFPNLWHILLEAAGRDGAGEILCVFDALDECEEISRSQFTRELLNLHHSGKYPNLRFLLTSRPFGKIQRGFQLPDGPGLSVVHLGGENEEEVAKISKEIDVFIKARVPSISARLRLRQNEQDFLLDELLRTPHRTYLWVYLTLQHIEGNINIDQKEIMKAISELPKSVDEAYERILCSSTNADEARKILMAIVAAARPLTVQEVNFVLAIKENHRSYGDLQMMGAEDRFRHRLRDVCGLFVTVIDSKVYLLHQTAREFLVREKLGRKRHKSDPKWKWKHSISIIESNYLLARVCVWNLEFREVKVHVNVDRNIRTVAQTAGREVECQGNHLFLDYSAVNFGYHVRGSIALAEKDKLLTRHLVALCHEVECSCPVWYTVHTPAVEPKRIALVFASKIGLAPAVKVLVKEKNCDIDARDSSGWSALSWAVAYGFTDVSRILIKGQGLYRRLFSPMKAAFDQKVLISACKNPWGIEMVRLLLDHKANLDVQDEDGHTPLTAAILSGQIETVKLLHDRNPDIMRQYPPHMPLLLACQNRDLEMVKFLLENGANIEPNGDQLVANKNIVDREVALFLLESVADRQWVNDAPKRTPLNTAIFNRQPDLLQLLLDHGAVIRGWEPLFFAVQDGDVAFVRQLLKHGADVKLKNNNGDSVLSFACHCALSDPEKRQKPDFTMLKCLASTGLEFEVRDPWSRTALTTAIGLCSEEYVRLLLDLKAEVDYDIFGGLTPLAFAIKEFWRILSSVLDTEKARSIRNIMTLLLERGANIESRFWSGRTPLSYLVEYKSEDLELSNDQHDEWVSVVDLFLRGHHADINSKDKSGRSVLSWACEKGTADMVKVLLDAGADVESKGLKGQSVLSWACEKGRADVVKVLLDAGADVESKDLKGRSVLSWATLWGHADIIKVLLDAGADVESKDLKGRSVLSWAMMSAKTDIVKILLDAGADVESKDLSGRSVLSWAVHWRGADIVKMILDAGADVESKDLSGRSVLSWALQWRGADIVKMILDAGADVHSRDEDGRSVMQWLAAGRRDPDPDLEKLLVAYGAQR
ncbi:ankyrin repeat-containing domain protein [Cladorrhinum samala]|uniref:Ankyrin repeat-containing domain protein n=1 Tax=Cladorrhinum samala TaxID=585594 RepID=A0AAV9HPG6_9PEZI|nr:ankyrin repeat-containing domain protein [Cladorrhinum samala]